MVAYGSQALMAHKKKKKKLPLHQTQVPGAKMGSYRTLQGVLIISTLLS